MDDPTDLILVGADKRKISEQWAFEDITAILSQLGGGEATLGGLNVQSIARFETRQAVPAGLVQCPSSSRSDEGEPELMQVKYRPPIVLAPRWRRPGPRPGHLIVAGQVSPAV